VPGKKTNYVFLVNKERFNPPPRLYLSLLLIYALLLSVDAKPFKIPPLKGLVERISALGIDNEPIPAFKPAIQINELNPAN